MLMLFQIIHLIAKMVLIMVYICFEIVVVRDVRTGNNSNKFSKSGERGEIWFDCQHSVLKIHLHVFSFLNFWKYFPFFWHVPGTIGKARHTVLFHFWHFHRKTGMLKLKQRKEKEQKLSYHLWNVNVPYSLNLKLAFLSY